MDAGQEAYPELSSSQVKMSSIPRLKVRAIRNASPSEGVYLPLSMAMMVCRVTPTRPASSSCVISLCSKRKRLTQLDISDIVGLHVESVADQSGDCAYKVVRYGAQTHDGGKHMYGYL